MIVIEPGLDNIGYYVKIRYKTPFNLTPLFWIDCSGCQLAVIHSNDTSGVDVRNYRPIILGVDLL